jgi:hypothetical protein
MAHCRAWDLGGILLVLVLTRWGHQTQTVDVSHTSSWSDRPWSELSMSICVPEMIISMLDNLSHSNGHWHYILYGKLHIVDNNSLKIRGRGIKTTYCPRKKLLRSFHLQKIALVLVKILYCFGAKAIGNLYRYFICMSPPLSDWDIRYMYSVTHVRNSEIFQLWPLFFAILWDIIDLIFGMWVYNDKLQIKFTFRPVVIFAEFWPLDFEIWPNI